MLNLEVKGSCEIPCSIYRIILEIKFSGSHQPEQKGKKYTGDMTT